MYGAIALVVIVALIGGFLWYQRNEEQKRKEAEIEKARTKLREALKPFAKIEDTPSDEEKEYVKISVNQSADFGNYTLKIVKTEIVDILKGDSFTPDEKPTNKFVKITLEGKNIGDKPDFVSLSGIKLKTKDGKTYNQISRSAYFEQATQEEVPAGYKGCIACEQNPGVTSWQYVIFDVPVTTADGARLIFEDAPDKNNYEFLM